MKMKETSALRRFGVSMDEELLSEFDKLIARKGYDTRSEAICDLARSALAEDILADDKAEAVATISLVYNHHVPNLTSKLTDAQHHALDLITSVLHVHLDEKRCLEVLVVRGAYGQVRGLADKLISIKGVKYGEFVTTTGHSKTQARRGRSHKHSHSTRSGVPADHEHYR